MLRSRDTLDVLDIPMPSLMRIAAGTSLLIALFRATPVFVMSGEPFGFAIRQFGFTLFFTLLLWGINIGLFHLLLPLRSPQAKAWRIGLSLLTSITLGWLLFHFIMEHFRPPFPVRTDMPLPPPRGRFLMPALQFVSIDLLILMVMEMTMMKRARDRVARENDALKMAGLEARVNALRAQLQPHFLFNALTALKALNRQSPERADRYIDELAALLRSSIQDREALIPLHEEYELCVKYLGLQKLRFGEALQVDLQGQVGRSTSWLIPMYSLQQLAENAIKHNTLTTTSPLRLSIRFDPDTQTVTAMNNLQKRADADPGDGIGLKNLDERCLLLGLGPIKMNADADHFSVTIKLKRA